jgi:hypothetical protein
MGRRLEVVAAMGERARDENVALMMKIISELPDEARRRLVETPPGSSPMPTTPPERASWHPWARCSAPSPNPSDGR